MTELVLGVLLLAVGIMECRLQLFAVRRRMVTQPSTADALGDRPVGDSLGQRAEPSGVELRPWWNSLLRANGQRPGFWLLVILLVGILGSTMLHYVVKLRPVSQLIPIFDKIPVSAWLVMLVAVRAYTHLSYAHQHIEYPPVRRDEAKPVEDFSWRTPTQFVVGLTVLCALIVLATLILMSGEARFVHSQNFLPVLMIGSAGWAFLTIVRGISVGQIKRWPRGLLNYQRDVDPIAFWAIVKANALAGLMCLLAALGAYAFI